MASRYSQLSNNALFEAQGTKYRKLDELYYEDLVTGFQSVWTPIFDNSISSGSPAKPDSEANTTDMYLVDPRTRMMTVNPDYVADLSEGDKVLAQMWHTGEYESNSYKDIADTSITAVQSMNALAKVVGVAASASQFPSIVASLTLAYKEYSKPKKGKTTNA